MRMTGGTSTMFEPAVSLGVPWDWIWGFPHFVDQGFPARVDISLVRPDKWRPEDNLVSHVQHHKQNQTDISDEKIRHFEMRNKGRKPLSQGDERVEEQSIIGKIRLPKRLVRKQIAWNVARFQSPHKRNVTSIQGSPGDETSHPGDVCQPGEDSATLVGQVQKC